MSVTLNDSETGEVKAEFMFDEMKWRIVPTHFILLWRPTSFSDETAPLPMSYFKDQMDGFKTFSYVKPFVIWLIRKNDQPSQRYLMLKKSLELQNQSSPQK